MDAVWMQSPCILSIAILLPRWLAGKEFAMEGYLERLVELQTEQNELLKKHLVRLKFSVRALLLLTTAISVALGFTIWVQQSSIVRIAPRTTTVYPATVATWMSSPAPQGAAQIRYQPLPSVQLNVPHEEATGSGTGSK
jgi:hypothetical protein